jgi:3'-5' exoribonuclease
MVEAGAPEGLAPGRLLALEHCVAAHHGAEGAQISFASAEALALHRLNALDAGVKGALERGLAIK